MPLKVHQEKMKTHGLNDVAIKMFAKNFAALEKQDTCTISEKCLSPATEIPDYNSIQDLPPNPKLLGQTVFIKLNGGLGTSMGLKGVKSALEIKENTSFLDIIIKQLLILRKNSGQNIKLLLMNSFSTSEETLSLLEKYADQGLADKNEIELLQNQIPKICADTLEPITWNKDPNLEWCPPGHADVYTALLGSGWLDKLIEQGTQYAFISNSDNLGASLDPKILTYIHHKNIPFLMEVTRRTSSDKKGGHLAIRNVDNQLVLRELAQCPDGDTACFQNIEKHQFFNTNNLWIHLPTLKKVLDEQDGVMTLPVILNAKTVDPRDSDSPKVIQLETAMGSAIECFPNAAALNVDRSRFAPVKKTNDLLAIRSDAYIQDEKGQIKLAPERHGTPPNIDLSDEYKFVDSIANLGNPSLLYVNKVTIQGPVTFQDGVILKGDVSIINQSSKLLTIPSGTYENETITA